MYYQSNRMKLECIRVVLQGPVNDIYICRDLNTQGDVSYTLLVIKEHKTARKYLEVFEKAGERAEQAYIESFSDRENFCMVFPYQQERALKDFYMAGALSLGESEEICIRLILHCMETAMPYPLLYLILSQKQIHLAKDHSIFWSYQLDLEKLDETRTERDCTLLAAGILKELLQSKASYKGFTYRVLDKKINRQSYTRFVQLYKDLRITATPQKEKGMCRKILLWVKRYQDTLVRILFTICILLTLFAIVSLISQLLFGDIPWLRIIFNGFKEIGSQSLEQ